MLLVFDTNVFLQKEANLWELLDRFPTGQTAPFFLVGLDNSGEIENEYIKYAKGLPNEDPVRVLVKRILDGTSLFIKRITPELSDRLSDRLKVNGCMEPIQPQLFGVAEQTRGTLVCPNKTDNLSIPRNYLRGNIIHKLQFDGVQHQIKSLADVLELLRKPREFSPENLSDLEALLEELGSKEREYIEFKNPHVQYLTQPLLRDAVRAICGMLNSRNGWVFIGVDDEGSITPFPPKYVPPHREPESKSLSLDLLLREIYNEIDRINPEPGERVKAWPITDENSNVVVAINVIKGNMEFLYRDRAGKLNGAKWIRSGSRTKEDPDWNK